MKTSAKDRLRAHIAEWAVRLRVEPRQVRIQKMRRKWGSCSVAGCVTFADDLTKRPHAFQEFVIVHELLHLRIRNHGKLFCAVLRTHLKGNRMSITRSPAVHVLRNGHKS
jgi:predicted metal-dependent hydrolase